MGMTFERRYEKEVTVTVSGKEYLVAVREIPCREGVELSCWIEDDEIRVSDRGLGEHEALRLMKEEIARFESEGRINEI